MRKKKPLRVQLNSGPKVFQLQMTSNEKEGGSREIISLFHLLKPYAQLNRNYKLSKSFWIHNNAPLSELDCKISFKLLITASKRL